MLAMESGKIDLQYLPDARWKWTKMRGYLKRYGVDIMNEDIADNYAACVW